MEVSVEGRGNTPRWDLTVRTTIDFFIGASKMSGMKRTLRCLPVVLVLLCALFAQVTKPYDGWTTTILNSGVNKNGLRIINTESWLGDRRHTLMFKCNESDKSCSAPQVDTVYSLSASDKYYKCDEYTLSRSNESPIIVCLVSVQ